MEQPVKKQRGGARVGAGRKSDVARKVVTIRIDASLVSKMANEPSKSLLIERLLNEFYNKT